MCVIDKLTNKEDNLDIVERVLVLRPAAADGGPGLEVLHGAADDDEEVGRGGVRATQPGRGEQRCHSLGLQ